MGGLENANSRRDEMLRLQHVATWALRVVEFKAFCDEERMIDPLVKRIGLAEAVEPRRMPESPRSR
jgi:hypothetical protein